ncbi:branched-chain amino acid ABC transporter permease (plasmid) [Rhizobium sp. TRM96647]|uniref:branched-chain amino acid ABC transporter permease n=1 Tax=unclassified Rhizobium TaxID=2613769 RepID=UPI0021E6E8ED|nr:MULTISPECIES: branched-chain amino acid ABC transporter permease [unclassified Rhizobium]MCV3735160.1 branched-chain amino acid ABC transporter permease [Rhizobium sp. TRM96647]MCV3758076.1 branched-chain amino acid ABC transporter permease [Rhizobium sp. TRM96650]
MDILTYGLISASVVLLSALGFAMILKVEGFLNIAHGQMLLLGGYIGLLFSNLGLSIGLSAVLAAMICGILGVLFYRAFFRPVKARGALVLLFTSVGIAYVVHGLVGVVAGKRMLAYDLPPVRAMQLFGEPFMTVYELAIFIVAVLSALLMHLFLTHTWSGKSIRAVSDNEALARARGFNPTNTSDLVWFIASALGGLAGVFLGVIGSLHLQMGWQQIIVILATTVLGGLGSIYGVMLASVVLAFGIEFGLLFSSANYRTGLAFLIIIVVLLIKPEGLQALWGGGKARTH